MQVVVSVGTDVHPFDRLIEWAERWAATHPDDSVIVQHGATRPPVGVEHAPFLRREDLRARIERADAVVISCGPGGVMEVRSTGRRPIVVARRTDLGEHVDDHQLAFARHLADARLATCVESEQELHDALEDARSRPETWTVEPDPSPPAGIARIGELIDELVWGS